LKIRVVYRQSPTSSNYEESYADPCELEVEHELHGGDEVLFHFKEGNLSVRKRRRGIWQVVEKKVYFTCPWCGRINLAPSEAAEERCFDKSLWCGPCRRHLFARFLGLSRDHPGFWNRRRKKP